MERGHEGSLSRAGTRVTLGVALVLDCGRKSTKNGLSSYKIMPSP